MNPIGTMQGRLVPPENGTIQCFPRQRWEDEFSVARECGLAAIEWIYDGYGEGCNPIGTDDGVARMLALSESSGIRVRSVCADYFMEFPLIRCEPAERDRRLRRLEWLIERSERLGIERIVLPFVDNSSLRTAEEMAEITDILLRQVPLLERTGIEIHQETDMDPRGLAEFMEGLPADRFWVNYDSGNSAALGYLPREEFAAYGARVGSVHVKDRVLNGGTVPLGQGDCDLAGVFKILRDIGYDRDIILQVARGTDGDEAAWATANRKTVERLLKGEC